MKSFRRRRRRDARPLHLESLEGRRLLAVSASLFASDVAVGSAGGWFHVVYQSDAGIDVSTIDSSDLRVTGPAGFSEPVQFVDLTKPDTPANPTSVVARYRIAPPGLAWQVSDVGTYSVNVRANQVRDAGGINLATGSIGQFAVTAAWRIPTGIANFSPVDTFVLGADGTGAGIDTGGSIWRWDGAEFIGPLSDGLSPFYYSRDVRVDARGRIHVAYHDLISSPSRVMHAVYDPTTASWEKNTVATLSTGRNLQSNSLFVVMSSDDVPRVFWAEYSNNDGSTVVLDARRTGAAWTVEQVPLTTPPASISGSFQGMSVALDRDGRPWLAFIAQNSAKVAVAHKSGSGWVTEVLSAEGTRPIITTAPTGAVGVAYLMPSNSPWIAEGPGIGFASRSTNGWSFDTVAASPAAGPANRAIAYDAPKSLVFDDKGNPHVYFAGAGTGVTPTGTEFVATREAGAWRATALRTNLVKSGFPMLSGGLTASPSGGDLVIGANSRMFRRQGSNPLRATVSLADVSSDQTDMGSNAHRFMIRFGSLSGIDRSSIDSSDIEVTGPGGYRQLATLQTAAERIEMVGGGYSPGKTISSTWFATYEITSPGPAWTTADAGSYSIRLRDGEITSATGEAFAGFVVGAFKVAVTKTTNVVRDMGTAVRASGNTIAGLAFGLDGFPRLATLTHGGANNWEGFPKLRVSQWTGAGWNHVELLEFQKYVPRLDLVVDGNGRSIVAYQPFFIVDSPVLTVRRWDGQQQETWTFPDGSEGFSLAVDHEGQPALAYIDTANAYLKLARFDGTQWRVSRIDVDGVSFSNDFKHPSLAFDRDGNPHISYFASLGQPTYERELRYATWDGEDWRITVVRRGSENAFSNAALAVDSRGMPAIATRINGEVRLFRPGNAGWTSEPLDPVTRGGNLTGLKFDAEDRPNLLVTVSHQFPIGGSTSASVLLMVRENSGWRGELLKHAEGSNYATLQGTRLAVTPSGRPAVVLQKSNDDYGNGPFWLARDPIEPTFTKANVAIGRVEFGSTQQGYAFLHSGKVRQVTMGGKPVTTAQLPAGWQMRGVWASGSGYQAFLFDGKGTFSIWTLDSKGAFISSQRQAVTQINLLETQVGFDLNQDGIRTTFTKANVVVGGVEFGSTQQGYAFIHNGHLRQVTSGGRPVTVAQLPIGWQMRGVWVSGTGYQAYLFDGKGTFSIWTLNSTGGFVSSQRQAVTQINLLESQVSFDLNQDGIRTTFTKANVVIGGVEFGSTPQGYAFIHNGHLRQVTSGGRNVTTAQLPAGWQMRGAWVSGSGYQAFLFDGKGTFSIWTLNSTGGFVSSQRQTAAQINLLESQVGFDLTQDGNISSFTKANVVIGGVEFGSTQQGYAFIQAGNLLQVTSGGKPVTSAQLPTGWQMRGVWASGTGYQAYLFDGKGTFSIWTLNSTGGFVSSQRRTTAQIAQIESTIKFDLDQNGKVGP